MKGQFFKGWGYMYFWLKDSHREHGPNMRHSELHDGVGDEVNHHGKIDSAHWREPIRGMLTALGATPQRTHFH